MARTIGIQKLGQSRLDNSLHIRFHQRVCEAISQADAEKIGLNSTLFNEYQACVGEEVSMLKNPGEENETEAIMKKDAECDRRLSFLLGVVRIMRLSPRPEQAEAAVRLYVLTRRKKRIQTEGIGRKPARIRFLLNELKKPENAADITLLHLDEAVSMLKKANDEMILKQMERSSIRTQKKRPSVTQIRPKTDEVYHDVMMQLQFAYSNNQPPIDREAIVELVNHLNQHTAHIRMIYKMSRAQRRARRHTDTASEPDEPTEPTEPTTNH